MPDFRMWDPWVTREMTIRDLLVHRSGLGLGEGDLLFLPNSTLSRKETVRRIRYLKPATSFRSGYAYDNILYMAAGQLIEEVSGQTWERYIHDHVFGPLGMNHSTDTDAEFQANPNHARPHSRSGGAIHGLGTQTPLDENATIAQNAAPAGGLAISANDMSRWLLTQLGRGKIPGSDKRLFSEEQSEQMWTGAVITADPPLSGRNSRSPNRTYNLYALGWDLDGLSRRQGRRARRRGARLAGDGRASPGQECRHFHRGQQRGRRDHPRPARTSCSTIISACPSDHGRRSATTSRSTGSTQAAKQVQTAQAKPANVGPSLPLDRYAGDYTDPWYGTIKVRQAGKGLDHRLPALERDGGAADPLSVRYVQDEPEARLGRARLCHLLDRRGRQGRPGDDEAGLADGGFQLGLSGPAVHAPPPRRPANRLQRTIRMVAPPSAESSALIDPPWASATWRAKLRPTPLPPLWVV